MKSAPFDYHRPADEAEALEMLGRLDNAKLLAGGQSLVAMLNMRYAMPDHLIDINRIPSLAGIAIEGDTVRIGAMTRQCTVLAHEALRARVPVIAEALDFTGHLQTRNRGTVGGSLGHMDPSAEIMGLAALLDATIHVAKAGVERDIAIADWPMGFLTPSIEPDEMIRAISFAPPGPRHGSAFTEFAQRHGDFAIVGAGAILEGGATITAVRIVLIGVSHGPVRLHEAEALLIGQAPTEAAFAAAAEIARQVDALEDAASAAYRQRLAGVLTKRVLATAAARMQGALV